MQSPTSYLVECVREVSVCVCACALANVSECVCVCECACACSCVCVCAHARAKGVRVKCGQATERAAQGLRVDDDRIRSDVRRQQSLLVHQNLDKAIEDRREWWDEAALARPGSVEVEEPPVPGLHTSQHMQSDRE